MERSFEGNRKLQYIELDLLSWSSVIFNLTPETAERTERQNTCKSLKYYVKNKSETKLRGQQMLI